MGNCVWSFEAAVDKIEVYKQETGCLAVGSLMNVFNIKIDGENVSPETVELGDLLDTLRSFRNAIIAAAVGAGQPRKEVFLSLSNIEKKCNLLTVGENSEAQAGRKQIAKAIRLRDLSIVPSVSRRELKHLWAKAASRAWTIAIQSSEAEAIINPAEGALVERYISGRTTIFAKVMRVGGAPPKVLVRLPDGERRTFQVLDKKVAEELGAKLYQFAVLHGTARWFRGTQKLDTFKVTSVGSYNEKKASPADTMAALSRIMGHHWQGVDADAYLREERSNDSP
jgi:hypothetical protein